MASGSRKCFGPRRSSSPANGKPCSPSSTQEEAQQAVCRWASSLESRSYPHPVAWTVGERSLAAASRAGRNARSRLSNLNGPSIEDLPGELRERIVARLRELEPEAIGVLAFGSYARGRATTSSDLDLAVLLDGPERVPYRTWFEELADGRLLHVSANTGLTSDIWQSWSEEPQDWAFGFAVTLVHEWVWVTERAKELPGETPILVCPAEASIEDMVETATKVRRARQIGDHDGVRFWASELVRYASPNLVLLNPSVEVHDRLLAMGKFRHVGLSTFAYVWGLIRPQFRPCSRLRPS